MIIVAEKTIKASIFIFVALNLFSPSFARCQARVSVKRLYWFAPGVSGEQGCSEGYLSLSGSLDDSGAETKCQCEDETFCYASALPDWFYKYKCHCPNGGNLIHDQNGECICDCY